MPRQFDFKKERRPTDGASGHGRPEGERDLGGMFVWLPHLQGLWHIAPPARALIETSQMTAAALVLACALDLLNANYGFPPVVLVSAPPPSASPGTAAFVVNRERIIYLVTSSGHFRLAEEAERHRGGRCANSNALKVVASMLAHEEWHLSHPNDEEGAYLHQLTTLNFLGLGGGTAEVSEIRRAMAHALRWRGRSRLGSAQKVERVSIGESELNGFLHEP